MSQAKASGIISEHLVWFVQYYLSDQTIFITGVGLVQRHLAC